jgi:hypothetical protein
MKGKKRSEHLVAVIDNIPFIAVSSTRQALSLK